MKKVESRKQKAESRRQKTESLASIAWVIALRGVGFTSLRGTKQPRIKRNERANNSGLPRRSYLTARNDDVRFSELCVSFANFAVKNIKPQRTQRFPQRTQRKNLVNLENLTKIIVQTKKNTNNEQ